MERAAVESSQLVFAARKLDVPVQLAKAPLALRHPWRARSDLPQTPTANFQQRRYLWWFNILVGSVAESLCKSEKDEVFHRTLLPETDSGDRDLISRFRERGTVSESRKFVAQNDFFAIELGTDSWLKKISQIAPNSGVGESSGRSVWGKSERTSQGWW